MSEQSEFYEQAGVAMTCRSFTEYEKMFVLEKVDLENGIILDIAAGAASFTATAKNNGFNAMAVDPLYNKTVSEMAQHGLSEIAIATEKLAKLQDKFDWTYYGSLEHHRQNRIESLEAFMKDYANEDAINTYIPSALPQLPFESNRFSLVLCSHFLFLYQEQFDYSFHLNALLEMLRVSQAGGQIRIYPVYDLKGFPYPNLEGLMSELENQGATVQLIASELPFLPGSTHFLNIRKLAV
jgi:hypothetical protein